MIGEKFRNKYFIAGGEHFTAAPEICLEQCKDLDAISLGEGEETLTELANAIDSNSSWFNIAGLVIRDNDKFIKTGTLASVIYLIQPIYSYILFNQLIVNINTFILTCIQFGKTIFHNRVLFAIQTSSDTILCVSGYAIHIFDADTLKPLYNYSVNELEPFHNSVITLVCFFQYHHYHVKPLFAIASQLQLYTDYKMQGKIKGR